MYIFCLSRSFALCVMYKGKQNRQEVLNERPEETKEWRRITFGGNGEGNCQLEKVAKNGTIHTHKHAHIEKKSNEFYVDMSCRFHFLTIIYEWIENFGLKSHFGLNFRLLARRSFSFTYSSTSFYIYLFLISLIIIIITVCCWFFVLLCAHSSLRIQIHRVRLYEKESEWVFFSTFCRFS